MFIDNRERDLINSLSNLDLERFTYFVKATFEK